MKKAFSLLILSLLVMALTINAQNTLNEDLGILKIDNSGMVQVNRGSTILMSDNHMKLDSVIEDFDSPSGLSISTYQYDDYGNLIEVNHKYSNSTSKFRIEYEWSENAFPVSEKVYDYRANLDDYRLVYQALIEYDNNHQILSVEKHGQPDFGSNSKDIKEGIHNKWEYEYDEDGKIITYIFSQFVDSNWVFVNKTHVLYSGDLKHKLLSFIWEDDQWVFTYEYKNTYNQNGELVLSETLKPDGIVYSYTEYIVDSAFYFLQKSYNRAYSEDPFKLNSKLEIVYNSQDSIILQQSFAYDNSIDSLFINRRIDFEYSESGNLLKETELRTSYSDYQLVPYRTLIYDYANNNDLIQYESLRFINSDTLNFLYSYQYDTQYSFESLVLPKEFKYFDINYGNISREAFTKDEFSHALIQKNGEEWNAETQEYEPYRNYLFYYSGVEFNSLNELQKTELFTFPNPASETIHIRGIDIKNTAVVNIYNSQGLLVISKEVQDEIISVKDLISGVYIYSISMDGIIYKGKFVKE